MPVAVTDTYPSVACPISMPCLPQHRGAAGHRDVSLTRRVKRHLRGCGCRAGGRSLVGDPPLVFALHLIPEKANESPEAIDITLAALQDRSLDIGALPRCPVMAFVRRSGICSCHVSLPLKHD